jgi:hypothetical protein
VSVKFAGLAVLPIHRDVRISSSIAGGYTRQGV